MLDLRILNGRVITDGTAVQRDVGVEAGQIAEVAAPGGLARGISEIDATGLWVLPGVVDAHFHCRAPSHPERGDFGSETRAAAAAGVTTVLEMPISEPACVTPDVLRSRRSLGDGQAYVDFGLYGGGAVASEADALAMAEAGAVGFKIFMHGPPPGREREFEGLCAVGEAELYTSFERCRATGLVCVVHAESEDLLRMFGAREPGGGIAARPPVIESAAVATVGAVAEAVGNRAHIAHLTSAEGVAAVRAARVMGAAQLTAETCPHYLVLDRSLLTTVGALAKVGPPLGGPDDREALWAGLKDGTISIVASDHAPFLPEEKLGVPLRLAPQGLPAVETLLPLVLDAALRGVLPVELAVSVLTDAPALLFGLYPRKGSIQVGSDADIVLVNPSVRRTLAASELLSRSARSGAVYDGLQVRGRIEKTLVRGTTVFDREAGVGARTGRFVAPNVAQEIGATTT